MKSLHVVLLRDTAVQYHMVSCDRNQQNAFVLENTGSKESGNHWDKCFLCASEYSPPGNVSLLLFLQSLSTIWWTQDVCYFSLAVVSLSSYKHSNVNNTNESTSINKSQSLLTKTWKDNQKHAKLFFYSPLRMSYLYEWISFLIPQPWCLYAHQLKKYSQVWKSIYYSYSE